ncbi:MAG: hypothetical protein ACYDEY_05580 [Acidimicrobiales bacterium]
MAGLTRDYNPFANLNLHIPLAYRDDVTRYTTTQGGEGDTSEESSPFMRYVDLWAVAVAVGAEEKAFVSLSVTEQHRFIQGSVLQGDLVRIEFLQLIAIAHMKDPYVVTDPKKVLEIADGYAAGGLPILMEWLDSAVQPPMVSVTKHIIRFLNEKNPSTSMLS